MQATVSWKSLAKKFDKSGMIDLLESFPTQLAEAERLGREFEIPQTGIAAAHILLVGMGGSAMAGDVARLLGRTRTPIPMTVIRDYSLPAWVNEKNLVVGLSYSGDTEETITAFQKAHERGASLFAVTSGGKLAAFCQSKNIPFVRIPGGRPPRTALGYLLIPLLLAFQRLDLFPGAEAELEELRQFVAEKVRQFGLEMDEKENLAKRLARRFQGKLPVFYAYGGLNAVALRWKAQINENAKQQAFWNVIPEMNHNEIVGWELAGQKTERSFFQIVFLRDRGDNARIQKRFEISGEILAKRGVDVLFLETEGESFLARFFSLILLADFTSFYLSLLNGVDPTPISVIDELKSRLREKG